MYVICDDFYSISVKAHVLSQRQVFCKKHLSCLRI